MGHIYPDGQEDDGRIIAMPTTDGAVLFQRQLCKDMKLRGADCYVMNDPQTGRRLTIGDVFDEHARVLLVIAEVEARAAQAPLDTNGPGVTGGA